MEIVNNDLELIEQAIDISVVSQLSFWDALIIAAAEKAHCAYVVSEDFNAGQTYRGVMVVNPFVTDTHPENHAHPDSDNLYGKSTVANALKMHFALTGLGFKYSTIKTPGVAWGFNTSPLSGLGL